MSRVIVQDANVFIDLQTGRLLDVVLALDWEFHTTDAVLDEVEERLEPYVEKGRIRVRVLSGDEIIETALERARQPRYVSIEDCSLMRLAMELEATLLTGDANLRFCAETRDITVRGTLWILDRLVESGKVPSNRVCEALIRMMKAGRRLPTMECEARIKKWQ